MTKIADQCYEKLNDAYLLDLAHKRLNELEDNK